MTLVFGKQEANINRGAPLHAPLGDLTQPGLLLSTNSRDQGRNSATKPLSGMHKALNFMLSTIHECTHPRKVRDVVSFRVSVDRKDGIEVPGSWICSVSGAGLVIFVVYWVVFSL